MRSLLVLLPVAVLAFPGCDTGVRYVGPGSGLTTTYDTGATASPSQIPACDRREVNGTCTAYTGPGWDGPSIQSDCANGVLTNNGCPPSEIGGCQRAPGASLEFVLWYYQGSFQEVSEAALQTECEFNGGVWR